MRKLSCLLLLFISCKDHSAGKKDAKKDTLTAVLIPDTTIKNAPADTAFKFNIAKRPVKLHAVPVKLAKGIEFNLNVPDKYNVSIAAEGLNRLRFLAMSPDGRLFATDMYDKSDNHRGRILILEKWNDSARRFQKISTYLDKLHNPNQVSFYKNYIYVAETDKLSRYVYNNGDSIAPDTATVIARFPAYGLSYKYGGWHLTRSIAFHNDKLYISVGSSCNACIEKEELRAAIIEMDPGGSDAIFFARGLRNSVGIKWIGNQLWSTGMGRDLIGPDKPEDLFQQVERNGYYGWPFYYQYQNKIYDDLQFTDSSRAAWVKKPPVSFAGFKAHSAPLGFEYFKDFSDTLFNNSVLVCLHGSTSVWRERGNSVVRIEGGNDYTEIVSGFLTGKTEAGRHGRPCDILMKDANSFFITDDLNGVLYYIWK